jgi:hypothetical protein
VTSWIINKAEEVGGCRGASPRPDIAEESLISIKLNNSSNNRGRNGTRGKS